MSDDVVVVLSFHGRADTELCVKSLVDGSPGARILVIDNGSFDGVLESVTGRWPQVHALQTGRNLGFSGGINAGLTWALDAGAATVTVLNNDTLLPRGAISRWRPSRTKVSP
jgi:GT2 family glycosyltransferase